jgi:hypothetical protein
MSILSFEQPKKLRPQEEHNKMYSSEAKAANSYVPNMSIEDENKWKAKHIKGENERIEIRKTLHGVNLVIVVRKNEPITYPKHPHLPPYIMWPNEEQRKQIDHYNKLNEEYQVQKKKWEDAKNNIKISMNGSLWLNRFPDDTIVEFGMQQKAGNWEGYGPVDFISPKLEDNDIGEGWWFMDFTNNPYVKSDSPHFNKTYLQIGESN